MDELEIKKLREAMVEEQIEARGVRDRRVLEAMRTVPRHLFVPEVDPRIAYMDHPLPIGHGQTISQPYMVAFMCEVARLSPDDRVLEVGTGSGYGAAVLSRLAGDVYTIDIDPDLARRAEKILKSLGYDNIHVKCGDGCVDWRDQAPFDAIVVTAAPEEIPPELAAQLKDGGRLVVPVGHRFFTQELVLVEKHGERLTEDHLMPVSFVPLRRS